MRSTVLNKQGNGGSRGTTTSSRRGTACILDSMYESVFLPFAEIKVVEPKAP